MEFFLDTGEVDEIREAARLGIIDGVTTNPSLIAKSGRKQADVIKEITETSQLPSNDTWNNGSTEEVSPGEPWKKPYYVEYDFETQFYQVSMFNNEQIKVKLVEWVMLKNSE